MLDNERPHENDCKNTHESCYAVQIEAYAWKETIDNKNMITWVWLLRLRQEISLTWCSEGSLMVESAVSGVLEDCIVICLFMPLRGTPGCTILRVYKVMGPFCECKHVSFLLIDIEFSCETCDDKKDDEFL